MTYSVRPISSLEAPSLLREIPDPPKELWVAGHLPPPGLTLLTVVGSRKYTPYGRDVCRHLIAGLRGQPVGIVSGLALGIDGIAHDAALAAGLYTLAVPGSGLGERVLYPRTHVALAQRIIAAGGGLLSELSPDTPAAQWTFPQRNRIMAGIAEATLLIEAGERSGTLITARLASDYNRELLVVPGSIFADSSRGTHQFLKLGATPVMDSADILSALGIEVHPGMEKEEDIDLSLFSPDEARIISLLDRPRGRDEIITLLDIPAQTTNILLTKLEIAGVVVDDDGGIRRAS